MRSPTSKRRHDVAARIYRAAGRGARHGRRGALAAGPVFCDVSPGTMSLQPQDSALGAFLKALREEKIDCILIGAMAAIERGAPLMTVDWQCNSKTGVRQPASRSD